MWRDLFRYVAGAVQIKRQTDANTANIAILQQQVQELTAEVERLTTKLNQMRENNPYERENLVLKLELILTKFESRLPGGATIERHLLE